MTEAANEPRDSNTPKEPPFSEDKFHILIGLASNDQQEVRMRVALAPAGSVPGQDGTPNMADPAVFFGHWLNKNLEGLLSIAAHEYTTQMTLQTTRQNLAMVRDGMSEAPAIIVPGHAG